MERKQSELTVITKAKAEMERENIHAQTMAGRQQKAREGGWNGGFAPYGYELKEGNLYIVEDEAEVVRIIFDKFVHTSLGANGVTAWLNNHGYKKKVRHNGKLDAFSSHFVKSVLDNPVYKGKIAFGRRKTERIEGRRNEYHVVKQRTYPEYEGKHEAIVTEELWDAAHEKRIATGNRPEKIDKEHEYILSGLLRCPDCGSPMYGTVSHSKKRKDGTLYPPYFSYICRNPRGHTGHSCNWKHQISAPKVDKAVEEIILSLVSNPEFEAAVKEMIGQQLDMSELEAELEAYQKQLRQITGTQHKLEQQLDDLDTDDEHYERMYESLNRRLTDTFAALDDCERSILGVQARMDNVRKEKISRDSVFQYLLYFDRIYDKMNDAEKKTFMQSFISSIDIYPEKQANGQWIKTIHLNFPVSYNGEVVDAVSLPFGTIDETVCLLTQENTTHNMKLNPEPFEMIKNGQKTIELRLFDEKRQRIKVGDSIVFTETVTGEKLNVKVEKLHRFDSFDELYKSLPLLKCGYTEKNIANAKPSDMTEYYSIEEQKKYGVVGIEISLQG